VATVLTRINSSQVNDLLGTLTNNADQQLDDMFKIINEQGKELLSLLIKICKL
jgi:3,4-dihydroxy 2-butanone 4-phosphate synthase/GTP cyclohydrolase II